MCNRVTRCLHYTLLMFFALNEYNYSVLVFFIFYYVGLLYTYFAVFPEYVCELIFFINFTDKLKERQHLCTNNLNFFVC